MATRTKDQNAYAHGDWNALCDVCGFKFKASDLKKRWDGFMVCSNDWETRHESDFFRASKEDQSVDWVKPDSNADTATVTVTGKDHPLNPFFPNIMPTLIQDDGQYSWASQDILPEEMGDKHQTLNPVTGRTYLFSTTLTENRFLAITGNDFSGGKYHYNRMLKPEDFVTGKATSSDWHPNLEIQNYTVVADVIANPVNGEVNADLWSDDATDGQHVLTQPETAITTSDIGKARCFSIYAKKETQRYIVVGLTNKQDGAESVAYIWFDFDTATIVNLTKPDNIILYGAEDAGNGWYRLWISKEYIPSTITGDSGFNTSRIFLSEDGITNIYAGTGKGVYLYGGMVNTGTTPDPFVFTNTTQIWSGHLLNTRRVTSKIYKTTTDGSGSLSILVGSDRAIIPADAQGIVTISYTEDRWVIEDTLIL